MKINNIKLILAVIIGSALILAGLIYLQNISSTGPSLNQNETIDGPLVPEEQPISNPKNINTMNPTAIIKTNMGDIELELFANQMPITTGNFIDLAESGFYNGVKFHRVIEGFMIQSGDPNSKGDNEAIYGMGGPDKNVADEFVAGELLTNIRGTISMANTGQPNSGGSQWFINLADNTPLDFDKQPFTSKHPVFGRVINGMDVVDAIGTTETKERDIPVNPVIIETITINRG